MKRLRVLLLATVLCSPNGRAFCQGEAPDPSRFETVTLVQALEKPMELTVAPDGRVFWIELTGRLRAYLPSNGEVVEVGTLDVFAEQENGLLGLALDPEFEKNRQLYLLYSPVDFTGQRLSRFTLKGNVLDLESEQELLTFGEQRRECCHHAGALEFGPGGLLFIATGDNTHPGGDAHGFAPLDEREDRYPFDAQKGPSNTQSLSGKILRIRLTKEGYDIPVGNLFSDAAGGRPEIYAMGCRNPWRIGVDQRTGFVYWGEVGPDARNDGDRGPRGYDEINQARKAGNFGWPYFIADNQAYHDVDFASNEIGAAFDPNRPVNHSPNNKGATVLPPAQPAWIYYPYGDSDKFPELNAPGGRTACAGPVFDFDAGLKSSTQFPSHYDRCLFAFEWSRNWISAVHLDENSDIKRIERFLPGRTFKRPVDLEFGPEGSLYMLEYGTTWGVNKDSKLVRIDFHGGNRAPRPQIDLTGNIGPAPLVVHASTAGTLDPDGDALTYSWSLPPAEEVISTEANPQLTFEREGSFNLALTVKDPDGASATIAMPILVGNAPPQIRFTEPQDGSFLQLDKKNEWRLQVSDTEDGTSEKDLPAILERLAVDIRFQEGAPPGAGNDPAADMDPGRQSMVRSDCFNCHAVNHRIVGPAFQEIADKYRDDESARAVLTKRVRMGSSGVWGPVPMLPHSHHTEAETQKMVAWVLALNESASTLEVLRGVSGVLANQTTSGSYVLTATYTDRGSAVIGPLTDRAQVRLRHPLVEAEHFSSRKGNQTLSSKTASGGSFIGAINAGSHLCFEGVDLTQIGQVSLHVSSAGAGGSIELRADSMQGQVLAQCKIIPNGAWEEWYEITLPITDPGGLHDLYIVFQNPNGGNGLMNLDSVHFQRKAR